MWKEKATSGEAWEYCDIVLTVISSAELFVGRNLYLEGNVALLEELPSLG